LISHRAKDDIPERVLISLSRVNQSRVLALERIASDIDGVCAFDSGARSSALLYRRRVSDDFASRLRVCASLQSQRVCELDELDAVARNVSPVTFVRIGDEIAAEFVWNRRARVRRLCASRRERSKLRLYVFVLAPRQQIGPSVHQIVVRVAAPLDILQNRRV
jgi:hypothetical protein